MCNKISLSHWMLHLTAIVNKMWLHSEAYSEPSQTFCEDIKLFFAKKLFFWQKSWMFDWVLNAPLSLLLKWNSNYSRYSTLAKSLFWDLTGWFLGIKNTISLQKQKLWEENLKKFWPSKVQGNRSMGNKSITSNK